MKLVFSTLGMLALLCAVPFSTQAAVEITYDFRDPNGPLINPPSFPSLVFSATNIDPALLNSNQVPTITATPQVLPGGIVNVINTTGVSQGFWGLGVSWSGGIQTPFGTIPVSDTSPGLVDEFGPNETLNLTFDNFGLVTDVQMTVASVSLVGLNDTVRITLNGAFVADFDPGPSLGPTDIDLSALNIELTPGDIIGFTVPSSHDKYAVAGVTLNAEVIPEPGTVVVWSMLASTLAGACWIRRRRVEMEA